LFQTFRYSPLADGVSWFVTSRQRPSEEDGRIVDIRPPIGSHPVHWAPHMNEPAGPDDEDAALVRHGVPWRDVAG
jgi:hypothetical protein